MAENSPKSGAVYRESRAAARFRNQQDSGLTDRQATKGIEVVYYIERSDFLIKIGTSSDILQRLWQHRSKMDDDGLIVLAVEFGGRELERQRHEQFAHLRHGRTEIFEPADDLLDFIDTLRQQIKIA
jgi:hypothetical protein